MSATQTKNVEKVAESIVVRGVCSSLNAMNMPTFDNVIHLFGIMGYNIKIDKNGR